MTIIELTDDQRLALQAEQGKPLAVIDRATRQRYVLLSQHQFERVRSILEQSAPTMGAEVPPGILRSQQAFWRDLPELLKNKKNLGKTVCYFRDERIGIANSDTPLIRECVRRSIRDDEYDLFTIQPRDSPPWEPEEVEPLGPWHFADVSPTS